MCSGFNYPLESRLPDSLRALYFGWAFNQPLEVDGQPLLPDGLQTLTFGFYFNQPLEKDGKTLLPDGLQSLMFGLAP